MSKFFLCRHGSTALNTAGDAIRGWRDVPLTPKGEREGQQLALAIHHEGALDGIISSDLIRATKTAGFIAETTGAPIILVTRLARPWDLGNLTGEKFEDVKEQMFHLLDNPSVEAPGGESFNSFKTRCMTLIQSLHTYKGQNIALVTHHRVDVLVKAWQKSGSRRDGVVDEDTMKTKGIPPGGFRTITYDQLRPRQ